MWSSPNEAWGLLHIISFIIMLGALVVGILLGIKYKDKENDRKKDFVLMGFGLFLIAIEIFKQIFRVVTDGYYDLTLIPWQLCSTPMYVLPFLPLVKNEKVRKAFLGYSAFVSFTAAFFYFIKPTSILYSKYIIMSLHSLVWHAGMVGFGAFTMTGYRLLNKENIDGVIMGYVAFIVFALIGVGLNFLIHSIEPTAQTNLFYISYYNKELESPFSYPMLGSMFKSERPYPLFVLSFLVYFGVGAFSVFGIGILVTFLINKFKQKKQTK